MNSSFNDNDLDYIRSRIDIVELIESYIPLKKNGANYKACCPFHKEKTPSFVVSSQKNIYHCFGCHKGGDIFTFMMDWDNLSFPEAVVRLADRCNYTLTGSGQHNRNVVKKSEKDYLYDCMDKATIFYHDFLKTHPSAAAAKDYFFKRGFSAETLDKWKIGFAPSGSGLLVNFMKKSGFSADDLLKVGLLKKNDHGKLGERFFKRIIFPIFNEQKRVVSFGGRVIDDSLPKYINCSETLLYNKSKILYGFGHAKSRVREKKAVIIVEGYFDVLRLHENGIETAVAPCGTSLTEEQIMILRRYCDQMYLAFDSDQAGVNACLRKVDVILEQGIKAKVISFPKGEDPDSFVHRFGKEKFVEKIKQCEPILDFRIRVLEDSFGIQDEFGKTKVARSMMDLISKQPDKLLADSWVRKLSERLGFSQEVLRSEFGKSRNKYLKQQRVVYTEKQVSREADVPVWEKEILRLVLKGDKNILDLAKKLLKDNLFFNRLVALLWDDVLNHKGEGSLIENLVDRYRRDAQVFPLLTSISSQGDFDGDGEHYLRESIERLRLEYLNREIQSCLDSLERSSGEEDVSILEKLQELRQEKKRLS